MRLGDLNSVSTDPVRKLNSLEAVKADMLTQGVFQRARAWEDQTREMHVTCSVLICSQEKLEY